MTPGDAGMPRIANIDEEHERPFCGDRVCYIQTVYVATCAIRGSTQRRGLGLRLGLTASNRTPSLFLRFTVRFRLIWALRLVPGCGSRLVAVDILGAPVVAGGASRWLGLCSVVLGGCHIESPDAVSCPVRCRSCDGWPIPRHEANGVPHRVGAAALLWRPLHSIASTHRWS